MSAEYYPPPEASEPSQETQYSELNFSVPEVINYARRLGDEALANEFEAYLRWHDEYQVQVKLIIPNDEKKAPTYEFIFPEQES